jgi:predicted CXXCH cytochrome family protein
VAGGGDVAKIVSFSKRPDRDANGVCLGCHSRDEKVQHWAGGSHAANHVRGIDCHQVHAYAQKDAKENRINFDTSTRGALAAGAVSPETNAIIRPMSETNDACLKCHPTQAAQMSMPYHHPLREGKMSCVDCHDAHGGPSGNNLKTANINQLCLGCHAQYRGPFAYQHPPVTENCMPCHNAHGSPNTNLLSVSEPALCLQCHAGHHNGASRPLPDRCTNCHGSIHGADIATPSGGSRFIDKGPLGVPSEPPQPANPGLARAHAAMSSATLLQPVPSHAPTYALSAINGTLGFMSSHSAPPLLGTNMSGANDSSSTETGDASSAYSVTPGSYHLLDLTGFGGRVGEYDTLQQSAGANAVTSYVSPKNHTTVVSRGNVITADDYSVASQLTVADWLRFGFDTRGFVQQQDHYKFYAFPVMDVPPGGSPVDTTTDLIPSHATFGVKRRLGSAYAQFKVPKLPVHLYLNGNWQARVGTTQLAYLDENTTPAVFVGGVNTTCGQLCHYQSQLQPLNYTTRNIGGGADIDLGPVRPCIPGRCFYWAVYPGKRGDIDRQSSSVWPRSDRFSGRKLLHQSSVS